ncbi:MAG: hypothetical protein ACM3ML_29210 [Micromonosporaceae bacterium]
MLGDAMNLLLIVGLDLASVRCRMQKELERTAVERVTEQLDAALVEIRHLSVRLALEAPEESPEWIPTAGPSH